MPMCNQSECKHPAFYRYTWPGRDESYICTEHVNKLRSAAEAMGLYLQVLPLDTPPADAPIGGEK